MNAAFLLVTTTWLAGADPAPAIAPATPAPAATSSCTGGCDACCESHGHRLKSLFSHFKHDDCCDPCAKPAPAKPTCDSCCEKESLHSRLKGLFHRCNDSCDPCPKPACKTECKPVCKPECKPAPVVHGGCNACCEDKPNMWERLKARLHRHDECCDACGATTAPAKGEPIKAPKDGDPGKKLPEGGKEVKISSESDVTPTSAIVPAQGETKSPFELSHRYESRVGNAPDYSWLTGQLFYVHADGGLWVLRYAPLSTEDANGGGVVLARGMTMDSYRDGDLVTIKGQILGQKSSIFLGGPLYQAKSIELVERGQ